MLEVKGSPAKTIDEFDPTWKQWIPELRDRETGRSDGSSQLVTRAKAAQERDELNLALEFLIEAHDSLGTDPELLWQTAQLLEELGWKSRAEATAAIANLARLTRGAPYLEALTREDSETNCDRAVTDGAVHLRSAKWYRKALAPHFQAAGGGVFVKRSTGVVLYELERGA